MSSPRRARTDISKSAVCEKTNGLRIETSARCLRGADKSGREALLEKNKRHLRNEHHSQYAHLAYTWHRYDATECEYVSSWADEITKEREKVIKCAYVCMQSAILTDVRLGAYREIGCRRIGHRSTPGYKPEQQQIWSIRLCRPAFLNGLRTPIDPSAERQLIGGFVIIDL
ncbi:hypothetical protein LXL04_030429 [Taraxacum kok-saghyz]